MTAVAKSSITLPPHEHAAVLRLRDRIGAASNVEVVRRALKLLDEATERESLAREYAAASAAVSVTSSADLALFDELIDDALPR